MTGDRLTQGLGQKPRDADRGPPAVGEPAPEAERRQVSHGSLVLRPTPGVSLLGRGQEHTHSPGAALRVLAPPLRAGPERARPAGL